MDQSKANNRLLMLWKAANQSIRHYVLLYVVLNWFFRASAVSHPICVGMDWYDIFLVTFHLDWVHRHQPRMHFGLMWEMFSKIGQKNMNGLWEWKLEIFDCKSMDCKHNFLFLALVGDIFLVLQTWKTKSSHSVLGHFWSVIHFVKYSVAMKK